MLVSCCSPSFFTWGCGKELRLRHVGCKKELTDVYCMLLIGPQFLVRELPVLQIFRVMSYEIRFDNVIFFGFSIQFTLVLNSIPVIAFFCSSRSGVGSESSSNKQAFY